VLLSLVVYAGAALLWRERSLWGALVVMFVLQWLVFLVVDRYFLPLIPLLIYGLWRLALLLGGRWPRWRDPIVLAVLVVLTVSNTVMTVKVLVEQRTPGFLAHYSDGKYLPVQELADAIREQTPADAVLVVDPRLWAVLGYLADREAVPPDQIGQAWAWERPLFLVRPLPKGTPVNAVPPHSVGPPLVRVTHDQGHYSVNPLIPAGNAPSSGSGQP
jgi:hypothetical protein